MDGARLLVAEDDPELGPMLVELLGDEGYAVELAADGQRALHRALQYEHDALIIDRGLPAIDGLDLLARLRRQGVTAGALFLTAFGTVADRVAGLDAGAEDYLVKPFEVDELLARLRALLRRHADHADRLDLGSSRLDVPSRRVLPASGEPVELSGRECELLRALATRPARVFTREELLGRVFDDADTPGAVDLYVHYLRRKLGRGVIRTVRGVGYQMGST